MFDKSPERFPIKDQYVFLSHCGMSPLYRDAMLKEREIAEVQNRTASLVYARYDATLDGLRQAAGAAERASGCRPRNRGCRAGRATAG